MHQIYWAESQFALSMSLPYEWYAVLHAACCCCVTVCQSITVLGCRQCCRTQSLCCEEITRTRSLPRRTHSRKNACPILGLLGAEITTICCHTKCCPCEMLPISDSLIVRMACQQVVHSGCIQDAQLSYAVSGLKSPTRFTRRSQLYSHGCLWHASSKGYSSLCSLLSFVLVCVVLPQTHPLRMVSACHLWATSGSGTFVLQTPYYRLQKQTFVQIYS